MASEEVPHLISFSPIHMDNAVTQTMEADFKFETHLHHTVEIFACLEGEIVMNMLDRDITVRAGQFFVCFPDVPHGAKVGSDGPCTILQSHFHTRSLSEIASSRMSPNEFAFAFEISLGRRKYLLGKTDPQVLACLRGLQTEVSLGGEESEALIQLYLAQLNLFLSREVITAKSTISFYHNRYIQRASFFINENYSRKITVQDVADAAGITPRYLAKLFNENFDIGVSSYITYVRIGKAIDYISQHPGYPLNKLALDVGFSSQQHFSTVFREKMSVSPRRYFSLHIE